MSTGNHIIILHYLKTSTRTLKHTGEMTRIQTAKNTSQESKSIYSPKLVKSFCWHIDTYFNADQLTTVIIFLSECAYNNVTLGMKII